MTIAVGPPTALLTLILLPPLGLHPILGVWLLHLSVTAPKQLYALLSCRPSSCISAVAARTSGTSHMALGLRWRKVAYRLKLRLLQVLGV